MSAQPRECACCLRPYPQEEFVKILAPSMDEYITLQSRQLENIEESVVHQVQNSDAFGEMREQMRAIAEIVGDSSDKYDRANAQLEKVASEVEKQKAWFRSTDLDAKLENCRQDCQEMVDNILTTATTQITELSKRVDDIGGNTKRIMETDLAEFEERLIEELGDLMSHIDVQSHEEAIKMEDLERRLEAQAAATKTLHSNTELLVDYFESRLMEVSSQVAALKVSEIVNTERPPALPETILEQESTEYEILAPRRVVTRREDSLRSSDRNVTEYDTLRADSIRESSGSENSANFYNAGEVLTSSVAQETSEVEFANEAAQRSVESPVPRTTVRSAQLQTSPFVKNIEMQTEEELENKSVEQTTRLSSTRSLASSTTLSEEHEGTSVEGLLEDEMNRQRAAELIKTELKLNDDLIEKYSCIEAISAVRPNEAISRATSAIGPSPSIFRSAPVHITRSPDMTSPGQPEITRTDSSNIKPSKRYDLTNLFQNVLNMEREISPSQDNLTAAALESTCVANSAETDAPERVRPERVLLKGRELIDKVDDAYGYLQALSSASK